MKLSLPHDAWADLREPDEIPRKQARAFRESLFGTVDGIDLTGVNTDDKDALKLAAAQSTLSGHGLSGLEDMAEAMVLAVVADWSYGDEVTAEVLESIPDAAINAIYTECDEKGYIEKLMPDFGQSTDPDSPTSPSGS